MKGFKWHLLAGAMAATVVTSNASGQSAPARAPTGQVVDDSDSSVAEVIVTAQRRTESLQNVPIAITALGGEEIAERGLTDMRDVLALTPGATFTSYNAAEPVLSVRGISSGGEGAASDSGVLMLVDGEVISRDFLRSAPIFDIERVEVLRGPQGTTYGRNATGGVFHVISRRPGNEAGGDVRIEAGNYGNAKIDAGFDNPLGENTRSRLAVQYTRRDGYSEDVATGRDLDDRSSVAGRLTIVHDFSSDVRSTLRIHGSRERHGDTAPLKAYDPTLPVIGAPFSPSYTEPSTDKYKVITTPGGSFFDRDVWGYSHELRIDTGNIGLTALTSYRDGDNHFFQSSPLAYNNLDVHNRARVFSQEVRLESNATDKVYWVAGLFYLNERLRYGFDRFGGAASNFGPTTQQLRQVSRGQGFGIFGEVKWDIVPTVSLTVGGRYSHDKKKFAIDSRAQGPFAEFFVEDPSRPLIANVSDSWGKPTGRVSLQYRPSEAFMVYGSVSQGYKSGGFNSEPLNLVAATTPFDEETVLNLEAGIRAQLFDKRVRLNLTGFRMRYSDIQVSSFNANSIEITSNAAKATIKGVELEAVARPSRNLTFSIGAARYDAEFDKYVDLDGTDLAGTRLAKTPKWTLSMSAVADSPVIDDAGRLQLRADYATRSNIAHDAPADTRFGIRQGKDLIDLRLAWMPVSDKWETALFVRNLLDEAEKQYVFPQGILSQRFVSYGPPRTWGASVSFRY